MIPFRPPHEARYCNYVNSQVSNRNLSVYIFKVALHPELSRAAIKCNPQEHTFVFVHKYACVYIYIYFCFCSQICVYIYIYIYYKMLLLPSLLSPLRTVFTIIYPKQTMFLRYTMLQLFCIYSLGYM